ncbi:hypothetical protein BD311DRAFT_763931 [Dichomitus squalens]|uniref:DUF6534 domain-containing protein n=1 Tax=Dichomitus squalens TaxID=114155 RepID=A0A4Q9MGD2_9APHY|nr:hypothetical protein BD311DRAFT_763931 [Dichomitus squalens]
MSNLTDVNAEILAQLDKGSTIGISFIGAVASSMVYGVTCVQTFHYYRSPRVKTDQLWLRCTVLVLWLLDSAQSSFAIHLNYYYLIENYANPPGLLISTWSMPALIVMNALTSVLVKMFFTFRVWRLSQNVPIAGLCIFVTWACFVMTIYYPARMFSFHNLFDAESKLERYAVAGLALDAFAATLISSILIFYLYKGRSGMPRSDDMIGRLILLTVATGCLATLVAIGNLIAYVAAPQSLYVLFFHFLNAKMDANAIMTSLNSREYARQGSSYGKTLSTTVDSRTIPLSNFRAPAVERIYQGADNEAAVNSSEYKVDIDASYPK